MRFKIRQENEGRSQVPPLPRRGGVSSPPQRVAGIGLDEASMPAPPLSLPMNAAVTARTRKQRREGNDLRAPTRNRHNDRTTTPQPATFATGDTGNASGSRVASRDQVPPRQDLEDAGQGRGTQNDHPLRRTEDELQTVPRLDQPPLAAPAAEREQAHTANTHRPPRPVAVHTQPRGRVERPDRKRLLRGAANDLRLGWLGWQRRPALAVCTDAGSGDGVPPVRLLDGMARGAVAEHKPSLLGLPLTGPARVW